MTMRTTKEHYKFVTHLDPKGRITWANQYEFGFTEEEVLGKEIWSFHEGKNELAVKEQFGRALGGETVYYQYNVDCEDGKSRTFECKMMHARGIHYNEEDEGVVAFSRVVLSFREALPEQVTEFLDDEANDEEGATPEVRQQALDYLSERLSFSDCQALQYLFGRIVLSVEEEYDEAFFRKDM